MDEKVDRSRRQKVPDEAPKLDKAVERQPPKAAGQASPDKAPTEPVARDKTRAEAPQPEVIPAPPPPEESPEKPTEAPKRRRSTDGFVIGFIILALLGYGAYRLLAPAAHHQAQNARTGGAPQSVGIATVGKGNIRIVFTGLGTVTPLATVTVRTQINGQLTEVAFKEGQIVKKGDFLAQIDPRPYQLAEQQYEGQLAHDQGLLAQAQMDLARYETLVKQNSIAKQQAEDQAYVVQQNQGSVLTDQAQIATQKLNLVYAHIVSPIDGRVGLRLVDPGNYVQTSDTNGLAVLTQLKPMSVIFSLAEDDIPDVMAAMNTGTPLSATVFDRANVNELGTGKVTVLDNQIDTTTGMVKFRAEFPNDNEALFPNQFVNVQVLIKTLNDVVVAPNAAIQRGAPGTYVYIVNANNTVSVRPVKLGPSDNGMVQITSGLNAGDRVVTDGTDRLSDGARVITPGSTAANTPAGSGTAPTNGPGNGQHHHHRHQQQNPE